MYSRGTDRGGRRIKLPPGYDGSAFRHDTGELRRIGGDTEMKIHSPVWSEERPEAVEERHMDPIPRGMAAEPESEEEREESAPVKLAEQEDGGSLMAEKKEGGSFLEGLFSSLSSEDLLLLLVILLLLADNLPFGQTDGRSGADGRGQGSDAWDLILLLGILLAVR